MGLKVNLIEVKIDEKAVLSRVSPTLKKEVDNIKERFNETILADIYPWNRQTYRRFSGEIVTSPRNIVDSGEFARSCKIVWINDISCEIVWDVVYAKTIFYGTPRKPARDWITPTMNSDPYQYFKKERNFVIGNSI